ncbi:MAG: CvpA family protein [Oscillospiraceae bacterium]|nr:CvpA family protein [Oscillospiraceae bacterium]
MGTQFFWFYDILLIGVFVAIIYRSTRRGFASGVVSLAGLLLAFVVALGLSAPIADSIYNNWVRPGVIEKITYENSSNQNGTVNDAFSALRNTDMSKAIISGKTMEEFKAGMVVDAAGKTSLDLTAVDLSRTGLYDGDLGFFGIDAKKDFAESDSLNLGRVDINVSKLAVNELEDIILSRAVSMKIAEKSVANHEQLNQILDDTVPGFSKIVTGSVDLVSSLLINIINSESDSLESAVSDTLVKPVIIIPVRTLIFACIFAVISVIVSFVARALRLVRGIPAIGRLNSFLGGLLGAAQAVVVIFIICIGVRIIISLTSNNLIFLNTLTIDETGIFRHVYGLNFLNF